jgi:hypothetical protein
LILRDLVKKLKNETQYVYVANAELLIRIRKVINGAVFLNYAD